MDHSIFHPSKELKVSHVVVGNEQEPLLKVDSFMAGAHLLKQLAIRQNSFSPADNYYPGIRMPVPLIYTAALAKNLEKHIFDLFGLDPRRAKKAVSSFSIVTQQPKDLTLFQKIPHFDAASKNSLATVHYLSNYDSSGTALYRHKESGYEYIDSNRYGGYIQTVKEQFRGKEPLNYINESTSEYEKIASYSSKFNRLIMYRGSSLHSGFLPLDYAFDPRPETGRLTITSFFEFN